MKTKIDNQLDLLFLKKLKENAGAFILTNRKEYFDLQKRKYERKTILTKSKIYKLNRLNKLLSNMELKLFKECQEIEKNILLKRKSNFSIKDYEIDVEIQYYSDKIINRYKNEDLDFVFEQRWSSIYHKNKLNDASKQNIYPFVFNGRELVENSCSTFRTLADSYLTIDEILSIDKIWWDIQVRYQYERNFTKIIKSRKLQ